MMFSTARLRQTHRPLLRKGALAGLALLLAGMPAGLANAADQPKPVPPPDRPLLAERIAASLIGEGNGNVIFSPFGIEQVLGLIATASSDALLADVEAELGAPVEVVGQYGAMSPPTSGQLISANSLWVQKGSLSPGKSNTDALAAMFQAAIVEEDFASPEAVDRINEWFAENTAGAIPHFFESISPQTRAVAAQALVFRAPWLEPFDPLATQQETFTAAPNNQPVTVAMMHANRTMRYGWRDWGEVIEIPFRDDRFSLVAAIPRQGMSLQQVLPAILADMRRPADAAGRAPAFVDIAIPRISFGGDANLTELLQNLGPDSLFSSGHALSRLFRSPPALAAIAQSCRFRMDEEGAEVAVGTAAVAKRSLQQQPITVRFDRPFVFAVRHREIPPPLAVGYVADPSASQP